MKADTSLKGVSLSDFLSHIETKQEVARQFCRALLDAFDGSSTICYVAYDNKTECSVDGLVAEGMKVTNHDEADTLLALHALDITKFHPMCTNIDVRCKDTDVFVLLVHVKASSRTAMKITMIAGTTLKPKNIDIDKVVSKIGVEKSKALLGLHCFTGGDYGGKFHGVTKSRWLARMLERPENDSTIRCLSEFGSLSGNEQWEGIVLEKFVVQVYCPSFTFPSVNKLRYFLFRTKGTEGENLPPTQAALLPHIKRARVIAATALSYKDPYPTQPELVGNGWVMIDDVCVPHRTDLLPAPLAIMELVKCGCKTGCILNSCTCRKNNLVCTDICKCGSICQNDDHVYGTAGIESDDDE